MLANRAGATLEVGEIALREFLNLNPIPSSGDGALAFSLDLRPFWQVGGRQGISRRRLCGVFLRLYVPGVIEVKTSTAHNSSQPTTGRIKKDNDVIENVELTM